MIDVGDIPIYVNVSTTNFDSLSARKETSDILVVFDIAR